MLRSVLTQMMVAVALPALASPQFTPVNVPEHIYSGGWEHFVGGGLAVIDCNGDGFSDLFAAGGGTESMLLINKSETGSVIRLKDGTPDTLRQLSVTGAYPLDIDSDGRLDLVLLRAGENILMRGLPNCGFETFTSLGFSSPRRWTTAFSATWEQGHSLPTMAFGNYVDRLDPKGPFRACDVNALYRSQGPEYDAPVILEPGHCALSMLFSDWGRHGRTDLRISNDRHYYVDSGQEQMWAMESVPRNLSKADGWKTHKLWGMGIASRDVTGDGRPDVFLSSMGDQRLQILSDPNYPQFKDAPYDWGTTAHRPYIGGDGRPSTGWHIAFGDVQNDGLDDVFITKGNVDQMPDSAMDDPNNLLLQRPDGRFSETGAIAGLASLKRGRGGALVDLNNDGLLDVAVVNRRAAMEIWQNTTTNSGHWLALSLSQPAPNIGAVGSWVEVSANDKSLVRERTIGGGHAGGISGPEHFGLGAAETARARVTWPDGVVSDWVDLAINTRFQLVRDGSKVSPVPY